MRMSQVVSFLDLSVFPSVALVFFLAAFIAVLWKALATPSNQSMMQASIVLDEDTVVEPRFIELQTESNEQADSSKDGEAHNA